MQQKFDELEKLDIEKQLTKIEEFYNKVSVVSEKISLADNFFNTLDSINKKLENIEKKLPNRIIPKIPLGQIRRPGVIPRPINPITRIIPKPPIKK